MAAKAEIKDAVRGAVSDVVSEEITKARKMLTDGGDGTGTYKRGENNLKNIREIINKTKDEIIANCEEGTRRLS